MKGTYYLDSLLKKFFKRIQKLKPSSSWGGSDRGYSLSLLTLEEGLNRKSHGAIRFMCFGTLLP